MNLSYEEFEKIMKDNGDIYKFDHGDWIYNGMTIMRKYLPKATIECAGHDIIYFVGVNELIKAGITKEDTVILRDMNWFINEESLAHNV